MHFRNHSLTVVALYDPSNERDTLQSRARDGIVKKTQFRNRSLTVVAL